MEVNSELRAALNRSDKLPSILAYCKINWWFVDGTVDDFPVLTERCGYNAKLYSTEVTARDILSNAIDVPQEANRFMRALPLAVQENVEPYTD